MNKKISRIILEKGSQEIVPEKIINSYRYDVVKELLGTDNIGIELGVARGDFSKK